MSITPSTWAVLEQALEQAEAALVQLREALEAQSEPEPEPEPEPTPTQMHADVAVGLTRSGQYHKILSGVEVTQPGLLLLLELGIRHHPDMIEFGTGANGVAGAPLWNGRPLEFVGTFHSRNDSDSGMGRADRGTMLWMRRDPPVGPGTLEYEAGRIGGDHADTSGRIANAVRFVHGADLDNPIHAIAGYTNASRSDSRATVEIECLPGGLVLDMCCALHTCTPVGRELLYLDRHGEGLGGWEKSVVLHGSEARGEGMHTLTWTNEQPSSMSVLAVSLRPASAAVPIEPEPEPEEPEEPDDPPVEPEPPGEVFTLPVDRSRLLVSTRYYDSSRYDRDQKFTPLSGIATIRVQGMDQAVGGRRFEPRGDIEVYFSQTLVGKASAPHGVERAPIEVDTTKVPNGWHRCTLLTNDITLSPVPYQYFVHNGERPPVKPDTMPVWRGSYNLYKGLPYQDAMVPARFEPTVLSHEPREAVPFSEVLDVSRLHIRNVLPHRSGYTRRPNLAQVNGGVVVNTATKHPYHYSNILSRFPVLPVLDGPRGRGTCWFMTGMEVASDGGIIGTDTWRALRVTADGTVRTLFGWRHRSPPPYHMEAQEALANGLLELVGDWSAIPEERHGLWEPWGVFADPLSVEVDESLPLINGMFQHPRNPIMFAADRWNRLVRAEFDRLSHDTPPTITEFITGLSGSWQAKMHGRTIYITERERDAISMYSADTGEYLGDFLNHTGAPVHTIDRTRVARLNVPIEHARALPVVAPEGLDIVDDEFLYYASLPLKQIRRAPLTDPTAWEVMTEPHTDNNSNYMQISVGGKKSGFFPPGTMFPSTWSIRHAGFPEVILPDGVTRARLQSMGAASHAMGGKGCQHPGMGYSAASCVGQGRLFVSGSIEGLLMITQALPNDPDVDSASYQRGEAKWRAAGYDMISDGWFGHFGAQLPAMAADEDVAYYLQQTRNV